MPLGCCVCSESAIATIVSGPVPLMGSGAGGAPTFSSRLGALLGAGATD